MTPTGLRKRLARLAIALMIAIGGAVTFAPGAAHAATTCPDTYFCWYWLMSREGSYGLQYAYTSGWVRMNTLVDDSESSMDSQTGTHCPTTGHPFAYLSDTYMSTRWTALLGSAYHKIFNTFNPVSTNLGTLNMNNKFNDIWNSCR